MKKHWFRISLLAVLMFTMGLTAVSSATSASGASSSSGVRGADHLQRVRGAVALRLQPVQLGRAG